MNDPKMAQTNNDTMDSQYSPIQAINAKRTRGGPNLGEKRYARLSE